MNYHSKKGHSTTIICVPYKLEYSEKDNKFRIWIVDCRFSKILNMSNIQSCEVVGDGKVWNKKGYDGSDFFVLELLDERNALERVVLHFAHLKKEVERISHNTYKIKVYYNKFDETELVIRVLAFGPLVKVIEPNSFVLLIKERLIKQKSWGLK